MAQPNHTPHLALTEEALTVLFCLIDDAYAHLNPNGKRYEPLKRLADSEVNRARALPAAARRGERALLPARRRAVLFALVPWGGGALSFLVSSKGEEAQVLLGAPQAGDRTRAGGRSGDLARGLYLAGSLASAPGFPLGRFRWGGLGEVGVLQRLRGEAAPPVRPQPYPRLLRAHP